MPPRPPLAPLPGRPSTPAPTLGQVVQPSATPIGPPPQTPEEFESRRQGFEAFFRSPEVVSALIQFGIQALQPIPQGQTQLGALATAAGAGAQAAGRASEAGRKRELEDRQFGLEERKAAAEETRAESTTTQAQASLRQAAASERQVGVQEGAQKRLEEQQALDENFRRDELKFRESVQADTSAYHQAVVANQALQAKISAETNTLKKQQLQQEADLQTARLDASAEELARKLAVQERMNTDDNTIGLLKEAIRNENDAALFGNRAPRPLEEIAAEIQATITASQGLRQGSSAAPPPSAAGTEAPTGGATPGPDAAVKSAEQAAVAQLKKFDPTGLPLEEKKRLFQSPTRERLAREAYGDELVDKLKAEVQGTQSPRPSGEIPAGAIRNP